jgi:hypothetical protein
MPRTMGLVASLFVLGACRAACPTFPKQEVVHAIELPATQPGPPQDDRHPPPVTPPSPRTRKLALGDAHTCVSEPDGGVFCWGANSRGQVGDGTGQRRYAPVRVLPDAVDALGAGPEHTCADTRCWGRNDTGQLGDGTHTDRLAPVVATSIGGAGDPIAYEPHWVMTARSSCFVHPEEYGYFASCTSESAFPSRTCAEHVPCTEWLFEAHASADVLCARLSGYGGAPFSMIRCTKGGAHLERSAASNPDAEVVGRLPLDGLLSFALGRGFGCGVQLDGRVVCWGDLSRLLGGKTKREEIVSGYWSAKSIAVGDTFACFVRADGAVLCFGSERAMGLSRSRAGLGEPRLVPMLAPVESVAAGAHHACAMTSSTVACWGKNDEAQLGDGTLEDHIEPVGIILDRDESMTRLY